MKIYRSDFAVGFSENIFCLDMKTGVVLVAWVFVTFLITNQMHMSSRQSLPKTKGRDSSFSCM